ncbi:MAG: AI-2E family transporter [Alphaproteobacteria bacterium]|nr:AI-2E family transporter [Alphaproteobacteria bacterium]
MIKKYVLFFCLTALLVLGYFLFKSILFPFVLGFLMAYFLTPLAKKLKKKGCPKFLSISIVLFGFIFLMLSLTLIFIPFLEFEFIEIINKIQMHLPLLLEKIDTLWDNVKILFTSSSNLNLSQFIKQQTNEIISLGSNFIFSLVKQGVVFFNVLSLLVIAPIVSFYMMLSWDKMAEHFLHLFPLKTQDKVIETQKEINLILRGFVKGQSFVCLFLGLFYGIGFTLIGLPSGLLTGLFAGVLSFIPYVGSFFAFFMGLLLVFINQLPPYMYALTIGIFAIGQSIEGNFLTPKLVGEKVGLSPVWVIFALLAFGSLFGFTGLVVATPLSAIIALFIRKFVQFYKTTSFYKEN